MPVRVGVDVGGTFTDLVALDDERGTLLRYKVPSVPSAPERGVFAAVESLLEKVDVAGVARFSHSTTIATNALLGQENLTPARVALLTTAGFRDVIEIGRQNRSAIYDLFVTRPRPLVARADRVGVRERIDHTGAVLVALEPREVDDAVAAVRSRSGVESVAVCLLHAYANDEHERAAQDCAKVKPHLEGKTVRKVIVVPGKLVNIVAS